jgi:uncharacterized membrane protein
MYKTVSLFLNVSKNQSIQFYFIKDNTIKIVYLNVHSFCLVTLKSMHVFFQCESLNFTLDVVDLLEVLIAEP